MSEATGNLVPRIYANFRGVDFRGEEINLVRSPDSLNVWKDYKETESIRTRPAMKLDVSFDAPIYGIFFYKDMMLVHSGKNLYKVVNGEKTRLVINYGQEVFPSDSEYYSMNEVVSSAFIYDDVWYFKDGKKYLKYDGETLCVAYRDAYIPTTSIARKPTSDGTVGGGTLHEDINMLTGLRKNTFRGDGESRYFFVDATNIEEPITVKVNDKVVANYSVDKASGKITFDKAPDAPLTDGQDNVSIQFNKTVSGYLDSILECTLLQVFDNRVFFSGNPNYPNSVWHCSLNDPTYVSDMDFYREGMDSAQVKGMVAGNNALWVFREPSDANTNVFYHTPSIDDEYGKVYPSSHSSISIGCIGKAINFNDDIVFFSERGMEGISGDITTEQVAAHRSSLVDRKMIAEDDYANMLLEEWEGYLLIFIGNKVYLADSRTAFTNENHIEYEFFYWELEKRITSTRVHDGVLYLGTEDGVYTMTTETDENGCYIPRVDIESYWVTPKDKFKYPHMQKTTNKRGCVAEATGDITVYAKTEKTEFELIGTYENVTDYFVSRIKKKKFKDIQLKFYSKTRFSLETVSLECFVGAYVKR